MIWSSKAGCVQVLGVAEGFPGENGLAQVGRRALGWWDMGSEEDEQRESCFIKQELFKSSNQQRQCQLKTQNEAPLASIPVKTNPNFLCPFPGILF